MRAYPESVAAVVNGLIVLLVPSVVSGAAAIATMMGHGVQDNSVIVHPPGWTPFVPMAHTLLRFGIAMLPFAVLAAWRTWVHARRWRAAGTRGWQGVAEAGVCGWATVFVLLLPGFVARPTEAASYLVVVGSVAFIVGLGLGLLLRAAAIAVLKITISATG
jgi:hypothetical protein